MVSLIKPRLNKSKSWAVNQVKDNKDKYPNEDNILGKDP